MTPTTLRPDAFALASTVRTLGIGMTGLASVLSGTFLVALLMIMYLAGPGAALVPALVLAGYLAAAPGVFAHRTRATTAGATGGWLAAVLFGYAVLWSTLAVMF